MLNANPRPSRSTADRAAPGAGQQARRDLIRRAPVLLADHELNASTFTVRCAASTGLNLYDAVIAGWRAEGPPAWRRRRAGIATVKTLVDRDVGR